MLDNREFAVAVGSADHRYSRIVDIVRSNCFRLNNTELGRAVFTDILNNDLDYDEDEFSRYVKTKYAYLKRWIRANRDFSVLFDEYVSVLLYYLASKRPAELYKTWNGNPRLLDKIYTDLGISTNF
jgi:hypothetical protein